MQIDTSKITDAIAARIVSARVSRTTLSGYLSLGITVLVYLTVNPPVGVSPKTMGLLTVGLGILKAINGHLQQDAGEQKARLPDGEVAVVPSHETPDDPRAEPEVRP